MKTLSPKPFDPNSVIISYMTLRKIIGPLGICLVPVMILGSFVLDQTTNVQASVSAYYHTGMRDELVGIICGISLFLLSHHGDTWKDFLSSKLAGIFALGIAFFPTSPTNDKSDIMSIFHFITSGLFFITLACMSIFLFTKTVGRLSRKKIIRNRVYIVCGIIMIISVAGILIVRIPAVHESIAFIKPTLILETFALVSFGVSWLIKGEFLLKDN